MDASTVREVLGSRVLVRLVVGQQITPGGIVIPSMAQKMQPYGDVVRVGSDNKDVKLGQRVLVSEAAGLQIEDRASERYVLYDPEDIIAIISPDD